MYRNIFGKKVSKTRAKEMINARKNRQELVAEHLDRRALAKMGLLTSAGYLISKSGLSARAESPLPDLELGSPPVRPFLEPLTIMPTKQPVNHLTPTPRVHPNFAAGESRTRDHQALTLFPPQKLYSVNQIPFQANFTPDLPLQPLWGFDGMFPGPTYVARYGEPILVRNFNNLPEESQNGGFGLPSTTTHLHNSHTPSESDGFPCDFFERGHWYDQHYPNQLAGVLSTHQSTGGDINEAMSTLWYHDHRVDFTASNVYKGLEGYYLLFNQFDTGNEGTGFHLPTHPHYDIPMMFNDKIFDTEDGLLFFDLFNIDGILGDRFMVNGKIQPFFQVHPRKYRFRWLNGGPTRFFEMFFTKTDNLSLKVPFWQISNDGNLLPKPIKVESVRLGVAERVDIIVDFSRFAGKSFYLENRLKQVDGRGPVAPPDDIWPAGQGNNMMRIDVVLPQVADHSADPATQHFYALPNKTEAPRIIRTMKFDRLNGQWSMNGQFMDCAQDPPRVRVTQNSVEHWIISNLSGDWQHPIHTHFEEHQILSRNRLPPPATEVARKDVTRLQHNERVELFFRFRDFMGRYPIHCHNLVHEDHAMMLRWDIVPFGDDQIVP